MTSIMSWVVLEINGVELLVNLMNSDRIREVIEWVEENMMWWMESELDKK